MTENLNLITNEEVDAAAVASAPTILNGTPQENKSIFDKLCKEVVIPKVNLLITAHMDIDAKVGNNTVIVTENKENIQELSKSIGNPSDLLRKNQGVENAGKILAVGEDGCVALSDPIDCGNIDTSALLRKNQGTSNAGKILVVGADGNLTLTDMPSGEVSDIIGIVGENNAITITGDLADGTYIFRYENTDGSYTDIGTLIVGGVVEYAIDSALTNCTASDTNAEVIEQNGTATLTFTANSGYELPENVAVSGASYTWNMETGTLVLSNPTTDVSITIQAIVYTPYTNVLPLAQEYASTSPYVSTDGKIGYCENARISASKPTATYMGTGISNVDTTALIPAKRGDVIRLKNCNMKVTPTNTSYGTKVMAFDSSKSVISAFSLIYSGFQTRVPTVTENDEYIQFTLEPLEAWTDSGIDSVAYIMISTDDLNENSIITINEEITE